MAYGLPMARPPAAEIDSSIALQALSIHLLLLFLQNFIQLVELGLDHDAAIARVRIVPVIILVVALGFVEFFEGRDLGDDGAGEIFLRRGLGLFRRHFLLVVVIENGGTVLRAGIRTLAIQGGGVVRRPEHIEQAFVGNLGRLELDLDGFGVAGGG